MSHCQILHHSDSIKRSLHMLCSYCSTTVAEFLPSEMFTRRSSAFGQGSRKHNGLLYSVFLHPQHPRLQCLSPKWLALSEPQCPESCICHHAKRQPNPTRQARGQTLEADRRHATIEGPNRRTFGVRGTLRIFAALFLSKSSQSGRAVVFPGAGCRPKSSIALASSLNLGEKGSL